MQFPLHRFSLAKTQLNPWVKIEHQTAAPKNVSGKHFWKDIYHTFDYTDFLKRPSVISLKAF